MQVATRAETGSVGVGQSVSLAELVATLSLAADLGLGQPMDHCMRQAVIGLRLADRMGLDEEEHVATYYLGLMRHVYCHADAAEQARWFGDDIAFKEETAEMVDMNSAQIMAFAIRRAASSGTRMEKARRVAAFPVSGTKLFRDFLTTHSTLAAQFAERIGLDDAVQTAILQAFEQWDGKGQPSQVAGESISPASRLVTLASSVEVYSRTRGVEAARKVARRQRGRIFEPAIADLFCDHADELLDGLDAAAGWDAVIAAEPRLSRRVSGPELDAVLEAMADLVDLKSPQFAGHSRGVAKLAEAAGRSSGLPEEEISVLRRAGLLHDLGRLGVSNAIWDKPGLLGESDRERVRFVPYLTERMLAGVGALGRSSELAARHHERLDGSGYPRGLTAAALSPSDRLLAAADVYHAMTEPRAHRPAMSAADAAAALRQEAKAGRLDGAAVGSVLNAAGHRAPARREWPAGLTAREVEVLGLLARGHPNKEIAARLTVTPKTVSNHVEHIYTKIGVSTRAAATLFATEQGLVGSFEPA
jgi:HD-GYP domain-containing protein (c-di-GMP phosphodiesterase class II)